MKEKMLSVGKIIQEMKQKPQLLFETHAFSSNQCTRKLATQSASVRISGKDKLAGYFIKVMWTLVQNVL